MENGTRDKVDGIREVFQYLGRFRGSTFVVKIDYPVIQHFAFPVLVRDLAQLRRFGIKVVIVAGAREKIDEVLALYHVESTIIGNSRITAPDAMPFVKMAAFDAATRILTLLTAAGASAIIGNWVRARTLGVKDGVDFMSSGEVERVRIAELRRLLDEDMVPIFPCIGWSALGDPYNISSNRLASVLAQSLRADKLFFLTTGLPPLPSRLTVVEAEEYLESRAGSSEYAAELLELSVETCRGGVNRVHILEGSSDGVILQEVFSNLGSGCMIYANQYAQIRPMRSEDVPDVLHIMQPWTAAGVLVPRDEQLMQRSVDDFSVYEVDGTIHGCGGIHQYGNRQAELLGIAVDKQYMEIGIGRELISYLILEAKRRGVEELFLLTTQTYDWFRQLGFRQGTVDDLPDDRRRSYDARRNSRVMLLNLTAAAD